MRFPVEESIQMCWDGCIYLIFRGSAGTFIVVSIWLAGLSAYQSMFFWTNCQ